MFIKSINKYFEKLIKSLKVKLLKQTKTILIKVAQKIYQIILNFMLAKIIKNHEK